MSSAKADVELPEPADARRQGKVYIIQGTTNEGRKFRPSDWAERMSGALSTFDGGRINYSPMLRPIAFNGVKSIVVHPDLEQSQPDLFQYIMDFARANDLRITEADSED